MSAPFIPIIHGAPAPDRPDEADTPANAEAIAAALVRQGYAAEIVEIDRDMDTLVPLAVRSPHVVFNLYEGSRGDPLLAPRPCSALERLGVRFTGASAEALTRTLTKTATKRALRDAGLPTPDWWPKGVGAEQQVRVIVKSDSEHASYGLDAGSVVPGREAAAEIAARQARFGGSFIAEAYVEGREFNVALLETSGGVEVLPVPEITFEGLPAGRPRIVDYEAKWDEASAAYQATTRRFGLARSEPGLDARLRDLALACWRTFDLAGYARVDFRVGADGAPFILEVNPNPCLAPDAGFAAAAAEAGIGYDRLIILIVEAAARAPLAQIACSVSAK
jgi:D-alanine-D-alanine ligase